MSGSRLNDFGAYRKALQLYDHVLDDMEKYLSKRSTGRLVSQQIDAAESICANIEEGYGRRTTAEYRRFLVVARGSLRETRGRYRRMRRWIPHNIVSQRMALAKEISRILNATIERLEEKEV